MARRRRGAEPQVPPSYGTPDVRWHPSRDHDAVQVAALHLQHLVLCEIRRQLGEAAAAHLSRLLGINMRTAQRITSGEHLLRVDELVELASLFGDDVLDVIPRTVIELFPEAYRSYLGDWTPGSQQLPAFVPPPVPEVVDWNGAAADLGNWLADELSAGRTGLVNEAVVAHHVAAFLAGEAIPSSLLMVVGTPATCPAGWLGLNILTRIPTHLRLGCLLDPLRDPVGALRDTLSVFYEVLAYGGERMALLCLGQGIRGQMQVHVPGLAAAQPGDVVTIPFQVGGQLDVPVARNERAPDLQLTVRASAASDPNAYVIAVGIGKGA